MSTINTNDAIKLEILVAVWIANIFRKVGIKINVMAI
jgi:hypothetical protein